MIASSLLSWMDGLMEAVWIVDSVSQRILAANRAAAELCGTTSEVLVGKLAIDFLASPQDVAFWDEVAAGMFHPIQSETLLLRADGRGIPVERRAQLVFPQDEPSVFVVSLRDIRQQRRVEEELEGIVAELRATLDSTADGILVRDQQGSIRNYNRRFAELWGIPIDLLLQRNDAAIDEFQAHSVVDPAAYLERLVQIRSNPETDAIDMLVLRSGRILERVTQRKFSRGVSTGRVYSFRDISHKVEAESRLRLAAKVFEFSPDAVFITDPDFKLLAMNPACERLTGYSMEHPLKLTARELFEETENASFFPSVEQALICHGHWQGELRRAIDGKGFMEVHLSWILVRNEAGEVLHTIGFVNDMTEKLQANQKIEKLAFQDALTGLPNRLLLAKLVNTALCSAERHGGQFAILFLDLDRFKNINDSMGHSFGDRVLIEVAQRIQQCLREGDILSRLGGDEFVVLLQDSEAKGSELVAQRVINALMVPFEAEGMSYTLGTSIGIALYPQDGQTLDELIMHADTAMYRVKGQGRGNFCFYQTQMNADLLSRMKMDHAMRRAFERNLFKLFYQPQIDMKTGQLIGAEALIRWTDPELGPVSPAVFIPMAEESGLIVGIGNWVLDEAVRQAAVWQRAGCPVVVAINVSALQFQQAHFVERIEMALRKEALPPELLELELTESILVADAEEALARLHALSAIGLKLSIDDFGTGYSSLSYLKRFPISKLKIDRSFVKGLPDDESDCAIVSATIGMASALKLTVIAEGVETELQRAFLSKVKCDSYQGFLCSPAVSPEAFEQLLAHQFNLEADWIDDQMTLLARNSAICASP